MDGLRRFRVLEPVAKHALTVERVDAVVVVSVLLEYGLGVLAEAGRVAPDLGRGTGEVHRASGHLDLAGGGMGDRLPHPAGEHLGVREYLRHVLDVARRDVVLAEATEEVGRREPPEVFVEERVEVVAVVDPVGVRREALVVDEVIALSALAPLFGSQMLTWIVNAGGLGIVTAWLMVAVSFLVLRYREPEMERPYKVPAGRFVGLAGLGLAAFFVYLYLPGGKSALAWPYEWAIVLLWCVLGVVLYSISEGHSDEHATEAARRLEQLDESA